jgi:hypothetical protein
MEVKDARPREKWGQTAAQALWANRIGSAGLPLFAGRFGPVFHMLHCFLIVSPCRKACMVKYHEKLQKDKIRAIYKLLNLFYVLGLTFGLILHDENINMVKGHDIRFEIHL